ncbi:uncharacterized protein THITE_2093054 [Thermothielavioides terrestris NRRL 8126]|uniref:Myb-like DNA-binding domain-containing protein n=1 Tax=Thermothielavioides terrestris (strain ATCC 38088 / NRRL 8126) TaxID=578455 RepID=G2RI96_THETT|nr:uncharacterized protein THITE_2093054 [Thermothielavioides terrestris NRRL 8126]AEO71558.1 hypothetical protein THITE_2093054 [Thermothielavioides terrestris NRRL 8126]
MPPKTPKAATGGEGPDGRKQPTAQEAFLFYTIIKNMKGKPEIDWAAVAVDANFKNAETAKVRYGQIKRKLGLDTWNAAKPKDGNDAAGEEGTPKTPATSRSKKTASTPGTGAGVKKRGSTSKSAAATTPSGGRGRKSSKSNAIIKAEDADDEGSFHDVDDYDNNMMMDLGAPIKPEFGNTNFTTGGSSSLSSVAAEYANFPAAIPDMVLERKAILVNVNGTWTVSPAPIEVHAQWLARLPAHIQSLFYTQAQVTASTSRAINNINNINNNKNGAATKGFLADDEDDLNAGTNHADHDAHDNDEHPAAQQLLRETFQAAGHPHPHHHQHIALSDVHVNMPVPMPMDMAAEMEMGYRVGGGGGAGGGVGAGAGGCGGRDIDLHSIPMHPSYMEQLERETRELEELDRAALFGGGGDDQDGY